MIRYRVIAAFSTRERLTKIVCEDELADTVRRAWALGATAVSADAL